MKNINLKGITKESVTGVLVLLLALINAVLQMFGLNTLPIENNDISVIISSVFVIGAALYNTDVPVTKASSALLGLTKDEVAEFEPSACIRCGRCVEVCPSNLIPQKLAEAAESFNDEAFEKLNGMECFECGSCTYVCPAKRRLTQSFKQSRQSVAAARRAKAAANK